METELKTNRAGIPYALLLGIEAIRFPTFWLLLYSDIIVIIVRNSLRVVIVTGGTIALQSLSCALCYYSNDYRPYRKALQEGLENFMQPYSNCYGPYFRKVRHRHHPSRLPRPRAWPHHTSRGRSDGTIDRV